MLYLSITLSNHFLQNMTKNRDRVSIISQELKLLLHPDKKAADDCL